MAANTGSVTIFAKAKNRAFAPAVSQIIVIVLLGINSSNVVLTLVLLSRSARHPACGSIIAFIHISLKLSLLTAIKKPHTALTQIGIPMQKCLLRSSLHSATLHSVPHYEVIIAGRREESPTRYSLLNNSKSISSFLH